jgi:hypothetical protein
MGINGHTHLTTDTIPNFCRPRCRAHKHIGHPQHLKALVWTRENPILHFCRIGQLLFSRFYGVADYRACLKPTNHHEFPEYRFGTHRHIYFRLQHRSKTINRYMSSVSVRPICRNTGRPQYATHDMLQKLGVIGIFSILIYTPYRKNATSITQR